MTEYDILTVKQFSEQMYRIQETDRDVVIGVGGFTGEGKSTFSTKACKEHGNISGLKWSFKLMTWDREELLLWIDGKEGSPKNTLTGLREGQVPEYSAISPDELFSMFYRRNWYEDGQIDAISTFNMCRDRHLFIIGNVPGFWDLDSSFTSRVRFYVYIPERGTAWVFEQENNPFTKDPWNAAENKKIFRKYKHPYNCPNFAYEVKFDDWDAEEKKEYLKIRNEKRLRIKKKKKNPESFKKIKRQRDAMIKWVLDIEPKDFKKKTTLKEISEITGLSIEGVRKSKLGIETETQT